MSAVITYVVMKMQDHRGWRGVGREEGREQDWPCSSTVVIMLEVLLLKLTMFILKECSIVPQLVWKPPSMMEIMTSVFPMIHLEYC